MIITDPRKIPQDQLPCMVNFGSTTDPINEDIQWWDNYPISHSMFCLNQGKFIWQGINNFYGERPMDSYLKKGGFLKFYQLVQINDDYRLALSQINQKWINAPPIEHMYNWLGIVGQIIGVHWLSFPGLYYCSQRVIAGLKYGKNKLPLLSSMPINNMDDNMNPAGLDKYFLSTGLVWTLAYTWNSTQGITV